MRLNRLISNKIFAPFKQGPFRSEDSRPCDRKSRKDGHGAFRAVRHSGRLN